MVVLCMMLARASRGSLMRNWTFTLNLQLLEQVEFIYMYIQRGI